MPSPAQVVCSLVSPCPQDIKCDLTPAQRRLYTALAEGSSWAKIDAFVRGRREAKAVLTSTPAAAPAAPTQPKRTKRPRSEEADASPTRHVLAALHYLRLVCDHPALVYRARARAAAADTKAAAVATAATGGAASAASGSARKRKRGGSRKKQRTSTEYDLDSSCKLRALKQLLLQCGIGQVHQSGSGMSGGGGDGGGRFDREDDEEDMELADAGGEGDATANSAPLPSDASAAEVAAAAKKAKPSHELESTAESLSRSAALSSVVAPHRALIFSQVM